MHPRGRSRSPRVSHLALRVSLSLPLILFICIFNSFYFGTNNLAFPSRCPRGLRFPRSSSSAGVVPLLSLILGFCQSPGPFFALQGGNPQSFPIRVSAGPCRITSPIPVFSSAPPVFSMPISLWFRGREGSGVGASLEPPPVAAVPGLPSPSRGENQHNNPAPNPNQSIDLQNEINEKITKKIKIGRGRAHPELPQEKSDISGGFCPTAARVSALCPPRNAGASAFPAPRSRRAAREALPPPQSPHRVLRLSALRPGEAVRDPAVPVHPRAGGAGHGPQPLRDAGTGSGDWVWHLPHFSSRPTSPHPKENPHIPK